MCLSACLAACGNGHPAPSAAAQALAVPVACADAFHRLDRRIIDLDANATDTRTDVAIGDVVRILLPASRASGQAWALQPDVPAFLCVESDPGSEGYRAVHPADTVDVWTFRAQRDGQGLVRFRMGRRWSAAAGDERAATFDIRVSP